jgi:hypothetical protein
MTLDGALAKIPNAIGTGLVSATIGWHRLPGAASIRVWQATTAGGC